jgi:8-oxo-dGTP pyrophosphatase MutT (NUDIX family)
MPNVKRSAFLFLVAPARAALFTRRSGTDPWRPLFWDVPGGQIEAHETWEQGLAREVREEIGLDIRGAPLTLVCLQRTTNRESRFYWLAVPDAFPVTFPDNEHDQFVWAYLGDAPNDVVDHVDGAIAHLFEQGLV